MELRVTGIGMATPLALDAAASCAAARAGLQHPTRSRSHFAIVTDGGAPPQALPTVVHAVPTVATGFFGYGRRLQIAAAALTDLVRADDWQDDPQTGFILLVGDNGYRRAFLQATRDALEGADESAEQEMAKSEAFINYLDQRFAGELARAVLGRVGVQTDAANQVTVIATSVGLGQALDQARAWFRSNVCARCIVGEVDSLVDATNLEALDGLKMLKTPEQPAALSPGEAATFVVLTPHTRSQKGGSIHAVLGGHRSGSGPGHPYIVAEDRGVQESFAELTAALAREVPPQDSVMLVANLNGDPYRSTTFSQIFYQSKDQRLRDPTYWLPALAFGDTGAACGLASVALLVRGWQRGYAPSRNALVCLQDDWGGRLVMSVRSN